MGWATPCMARVVGGAMNVIPHWPQNTLCHLACRGMRSITMHWGLGQRCRQMDSLPVLTSLSSSREEGPLNTAPCVALTVTR